MDAVKKLIEREPSKCSANDLSKFVDLVLAGGEVSPEGLGDRVLRACRLFFLELDDSLVAIAALKEPNESYRTHVADRSGTALEKEDYPYELGWVFVVPSARGNKYAIDLTRAAVQASRGRGIFATSRARNHAMHASLRKCGFSQVGKPYASERGRYDIHLFTRPGEAMEPDSDDK